MIKIAITPECIDLQKEPARIEAIIDGGWNRVHLRHPMASRSEMEQLLRAIPSRLHDHLAIHSHFDLTDEFRLGGVHLNRRNPDVPPGYQGAVSKSCHSIEEVFAASGMTYVTLSPIFDSISKQGYTSAFTPRQLEALSSCPTKVIALGGVTAERIDLIKRYNFSGFAMLGSLPWGLPPAEMSKFINRLNI